MSRSVPPIVRAPQGLPVVEPRQDTLANGIPLYSLACGTEEVVRVSLVLRAGTRYQQQKLVAGATLALLSEGTAHHTAQEIAERLDFIGASYEQEIDKDFAILSLYSLGKHLSTALDILADMVLEPTFAHAELSTFATKRRQQLQIEGQRVAYLARQEFMASIYGAQHPYGAYAVPTDYDRLTSEALRQFHTKHFCAGSGFVVATGRVEPKHLQMIAQAFEGLPQVPTEQPVVLPAYPQLVLQPTQHFVPREGAVQAAIRYGRLMFDKAHPDYAGMHILSMILGGYMGSRLMQNIREDKGYTYGISASMVNFELSGHLSIATEVGKGLAEATLGEIDHEVELLRSQPVGHHELEVVRNYLGGEILRALDGPWALAEALIEDVQDNMAVPYARQLYDQLMCITPERLQALAQTYLNPADMTKVVVGTM